MGWTMEMRRAAPPSAGRWTGGSPSRRTAAGQQYRVRSDRVEEKREAVPCLALRRASRISSRSAWFSMCGRVRLAVVEDSAVGVDPGQAVVGVQRRSDSPGCRLHPLGDQDDLRLQLPVSSWSAEILVQHPMNSAIERRIPQTPPEWSCGRVLCHAVPHFWTASVPIL